MFPSEWFYSHTNLSPVPFNLSNTCFISQQEEETDKKSSDSGELWRKFIASATSPKEEGEQLPLISSLWYKRSEIYDRDASSGTIWTFIKALKTRTCDTCEN